MTGKSKIPRRATHVRAVLRRLAEYEVEAIDRFRAHVHEAAVAQQQSITRRAGDLPEELQEYLADELHELEGITDLADELAIVALYRVVELRTASILTHKFGPEVKKAASRIDGVRTLLRKEGIDLDGTQHYRAINELRLLNNAVKHASRVSDELARQYPRWKKGNKLSELERSYDRLKKHVPAYLFRLSERVKLRFQPPRPQRDLDSFRTKSAGSKPIAS